MTLTKREIARLIQAAEPTISIREAVQLVDTLLAVMESSLNGNGAKVMVTNFGAFEVVERAPRRGVNPATGESMVIPARQAVAFHPAPALLEALNG